MHEMKRSNSASFITLTYDDEHLPLIDEVVEGKEYLLGRPTLSKRDFQLFMKRLRKLNSTLTNDKVVYYVCGEYGTRTKRPHYHAIIFNLHPSLLFDGVVTDVWKNGHARIDDCNLRTIQYVTKYVMKSLGKQWDVGQGEFSLMSKGIGKDFLTPATVNYYKQHQIPYVKWKDGQKLTMPRYFKERIWKDEPEILRDFGRQALAEVTPERLDSTKVFEIEQMNFKLKQMQYEKRSTV